MDKKAQNMTLNPPQIGYWALYAPAILFIAYGISGIIFTEKAILSSFDSLKILFLFTGLSFLFQCFEWKKASIILSTGLLIFSSLILMQDQTSWPIFPILENANTVSSICFALINLALLVRSAYSIFSMNNAAVVSLGTLIFVIAAIAFVGKVYGINRTAGLFLMNHVFSMAFMVAGLCLIASSWNTLKVNTSKNETPWYMIPWNICILTAALTYVLLLITYPSFQKEPNIRPEELLTIALLAGIIYYLRQAHQKSNEHEHTIEELNMARHSLINQEKLASLGVLVAGIAHEIKNPLSFIYNFSDLSASMVSDIKKDIEVHKENFQRDEWSKIEENFNDLSKNLESINKQSARANNTVQRMLLHARSKSDEMVPTNLNNLLDEYLTLSYQGFKANQPGFTVKFEKHYENPNSYIKIDSEGISRVLLNILNNAYYALVEQKNISDSTYMPTLTINTIQNTDHFEIRIKDNGGGISEETGKKIFTPFFTTKPSNIGTGLGLSLSRNIVEKEHNGSLTFQSQKGIFTEFIIKLPTT